MKTVFISHALKDQRYVSQLAASLRKEGVQVWIDEEQLQPGEDWEKSLRKGLAQSDLMLTVVGPSVDYPNVLFEAGAAIGLGKRVIFIIPENEVKYGRFPFALNSKNSLIRRTPTATARELVRSEFLNSKASPAIPQIGGSLRRVKAGR